MQLVQNKWFIPLLALALALSVSTARMYSYLDGVMSSYAQSFYVENKDHYVYWTFHTREIQQVINTLELKKEELAEAEERLNNWNTRLEAESKELKAARAQLETFRDGLSSIIIQSSESEMKNLKTLASTYSSMDPSAAVAVLGELDETTVVKIMALMKSDTVGSLFDVMAKAPGKEAQSRARIARISEKLRLYKQSQSR